MGNKINYNKNNNVSGAIGFSLLTKGNRKILLFSDAHSNIIYCSNNSINISDFLKNNMKKHNVILEEVPRSNYIKLKELWPDSKHIQNLKKLYLNNTNDIIPIDLRPYLLKFSWHYIEFDKEIGKNILLYNYLKNIISFFNKDNNEINIFINQLLKKKKEKKTGLSNHFKDLVELFNYFIKVLISKRLIPENLDDLNNSEFNKMNLNYIYENHYDILTYIDFFCDSIIEWYTILKCFSKNEDSIIHAGLSHSIKIKNILTDDNYGFIDEFSTGITDSIPDNIENKISSCIFIPNNIKEKLSTFF